MLSKYFNKLSIKRFISTNLSFIYNVRLRHRSGLTLLYPSSSGSVSLFRVRRPGSGTATDMREVVHGAPSMGWMDSLLNDDGTKWYALASITAGHRARVGQKKAKARLLRIVSLWRAHGKRVGRKLNQKMICILVIFIWECTRWRRYARTSTSDRDMSW